MGKPGAKLHLHIGRNKAGSTTLQDHWVRHATDLRRAGVRYAMFGQPAPPGTEAPSFASHHELIDFVREQTSGSVLVSHEGIGCFTPEITQIMAADLAELDVQLILYVRDYRRWVVSSYAFDVRMGVNGRDFDRYLERVSDNVSIWPILDIWGEALGWKNVRVRSLDPRDRTGGDLARDGHAAIGVELASGHAAPRANASPSWMVVELLRAIAAEDDPVGWDHGRQAVAEALHEYMQASLDGLGLGGHRANYLRPEQAKRLTDAYNRDLAALASKGHPPLQPDTPLTLEARPFLPALECVPPAVLRDTRRRALEPGAAHLHPEAAEFVQLPGFTGLCGL